MTLRLRAVTLAAVMILGLAAPMGAGAAESKQGLGAVQAAAARAKAKKPAVVRSWKVPGVRPVGKIDPRTFGIHSYQGAPGVKAGSLRIACVPTWRFLEPRKGEFRWEAMTDLLNQMDRNGIDDVMFSFCGTPEWAAKKPLPRPEVPPYWGPYASAAPANMADWRRFVTEVVVRYGDRIDSYETWNEATSPYLWQGTAVEMAQMTKILHDVVRQHDPSGMVLAANSQTVEQSNWFKTFFPAYMRALKARKWPVDAVTLHTYAGSPKTTAEQGMRRRAEALAYIVEAARKAGVPKSVELWDTETNYLGKDGSGKYQQAYLARTFLDSWRYGFDRTYWYYWVRNTDDWLGVHLEPGAPANKAWDTLAGWTSGAAFKGCRGSLGVQQCRFVRSGKSFIVAYADGLKAKRIPVTGRATVCPVSGSSCRKVRKTVSVDYLPVRIS